MRFGELKPRRARTKIMAQRRNNRFMRGIFSRFHAFKVMIKRGRARYPIRWWERD